MKTVAEMMAMRHLTERELVLSVMSPSELDVWRRLASGEARKDVARNRGTSPRTVDHQTHALYRKLNVKGTALLTLAAIKYGVVTQEKVD